MKRNVIRIVRPISKKKDNHSKQIKGQLKGKTLNLEIERGEWELHKGDDNLGADKMGVLNPHHATPALKRAIAKDRLSGMTVKEVSEKYSVAKKYVEAAVKDQYLDDKHGKKVLGKVLLQTAIAAASQTQARLDELNPMQSAVVSGIMTSKMIDLEKHEANQPKEVDVDKLSEVVDLLGDLSAIADQAPVEGNLLTEGEESDDNDLEKSED